MKYMLCSLALSIAASTDYARADIVSLPDYSDADIQYVDRTEVAKLGDAAAFVTQYLAALTYRTLALHLPLLHPSSKACVTAAKLDFFTTLVNRDWLPLEDTYKVGLLAITNADGATRDTNPPLRLSIAPTHVLVVSYGTPTSGRHLIRFVHKSADRYAAVLPCPDAEMLRRFREKAAGR